MKLYVLKNGFVGFYHIGLCYNELTYLQTKSVVKVTKRLGKDVPYTFA